MRHPAKRPLNRPSLKLVAACLCLLVLAGCASGPTIRSNADESADFGSFRTFAFMQPLSTDREGYQTIISAHFMAAAERELIALGLQRDDANPDLLINFSANLDQRLRVRQTPNSGFGAHRRGFYSTWPSYRTEVRQYTQGTLVVDAVDPARRQLVWEGVAQNRITASTAEDARPLIDLAMREIFARFPGRAD